MIKISEGELLDLLPSQLKNDIDMICLSYALKMAVGRLLLHERQSMTVNFIDSLPEHILDVLAVELRSPYYVQNMDIGVKRGIIKNTLIWHTRAGTASAVSEMISVLFGEGSVIEWPDFDEGEKTPGTFDIVTNALMTEDIVEYFMMIIRRVKNERSHLRRVLVERDVNVDVSVGVGAISTPVTKITNNRQERQSGIKVSGKAAAAVVLSPNIVITNGKKAERNIRLYGKSGVKTVLSPRITITNHPRREQGVDAVKLPVQTGAVSYPGIIIN